MSARLAQRLVRRALLWRCPASKHNARSVLHPAQVAAPLPLRAKCSSLRRLHSTAKASTSATAPADVTALVSTANLGALDRDDDDDDDDASDGTGAGALRCGGLRGCGNGRTLDVALRPKSQKYARRAAKTRWSSSWRA